MATTVTGTSGADFIDHDYPGYSGAQDKHIFGLADDDTIFGSGGIDTLEGGNGDDVIYLNDGYALGGAGDDTLYAESYEINVAQLQGGRGDDRYRLDEYSFEEVTILEHADEGYDWISIFTADLAPPGYVLPDHVEKLTGYWGSNAVLIGNDQDNEIIASFRLGGTAQIIGLGGNDYLESTARRASIDGGAGDDTILGQGSNTLVGGEGDDIIHVDTKLDVVIENADEGADTVVSEINYALGDNLENLTLTGAAVNGAGNDLDNVMRGNDLDNLINGGGGADRMKGGDGSDTYVVNDASDRVADTGGAADLVRSSVNFTLSGGIENLSLVGSADINGRGNGLDNLIKGNGASNILSGLEGADTLVGGRGDDELNGGAGPDQFVFSARFGNDVVRDFDSSGDVIAFDTAVFADFDDVMAHATQQGLHVIIDGGASGELTLKNVDIDTLDAADFDFFAG